MEIVFTREAREDITFWKKSGIIPFQNKISTIIEAIQVDPFKGIGKPEPLKYGLSEGWFLRINKEHRMVNEIKKDHIVVHYL